MSEELNDLMNDLHQMQVLLDFMIKGFAVLASESVDDKLRPSDDDISIQLLAIGC